MHAWTFKIQVAWKVTDFLRIKLQLYKYTYQLRKSLKLYFIMIIFITLNFWNFNLNNI